MLSYSYVNGKKLRNGYTTGTCATAAAKAAGEMLLKGSIIEVVEVITSSKVSLKLFVENIHITNDYVSCSIKKDSGDDPDITNGIDIYAKVSLRDDNKINIFGGKGIGRVTKEGLKIAVGQSAINPTPLKMIEEVMKNLGNRGFDVEISSPQGEELAKNTFNPKLGIVGGISILGSSGIVKPMSEEAFKDALAVEMEVLVKTSKKLVMTPGNFGKKYLIDFGIDEKDIFITSNFIGFMIDYALKLGIKEIILAGHIGKLVKVSMGIFHTHSKVADGRLEGLAIAGLLAGEDKKDILKVLESNTTDEALLYLKKKETLKILVEKIKKKCEERSNGQISFEVSIFGFSQGELCSTEKFREKVGGYYE